MIETIGLTYFYFFTWASTDWAMAFMGFCCLLFTSLAIKETIS